jgi:predicted DNA-binding antitoxin AbrB/MazE fold protein
MVIEAVYENGVLKPERPLPLAEHEKVRLAITPASEDYDPLAAVIGIGQSGRADGAEQHDQYLYGDLRR